MTVAACSTTSSKQEDTVKQAEQVKQVPISITAEIDKSGPAEPIKNGGMVVGYKYKRSFMVPAEKGNYFGFSYTAKQQLELEVGENKVKSEVKSQVPVTIKVTHP